jgi:sarcosine oxidase subunit beta
MKFTYDIVIAGGGIVGASIAFHLIQQGCKRIVILEKKHLGAGSTGRSSGVLRQFYTNKVLIDMARTGLEYYSQFPEITGAPSDFTKTGFILAGNESNAETIMKGYRFQQELGIRSHILTRDEMIRHHPFLHPNDITMGLFEEDAGYADAHASCLGFARYAREHGAVILQGTEVLDILTDADGVRAVLTNRGLIETRTVMNCAGPWASQIGSMVGVDLPIQTSRHHVLGVSLPVPQHRPFPIFSDPVRSVYVRPEGKRLALLGSNHPNDARDLVHPDQFTDDADMGKVTDIWERSSKPLPFLRSGDMSGSWSGIYAVTPDGFPILEKSKEVKGFFAACGLSGHGFKLAPAIGQIIASLVTRSEPDPRARMFRLSRFQENDYIDSVTTSALSSLKHELPSSAEVHHE